MAGDDNVIENPLSGEQIVIRQGAAQAGGGRLVWDLVLAPGGRVPSSHAHPEQQERFTVVAGQIRFRVGGRRLIAGPGETVTVRPGTVHHFANPGSVPARVSVETSPALGMEALLETAARLVQDQRAGARRFPRPVDLLLFMRDFEREVRAPYVPAALVQVAARPIAWLARHRAWDRRYRRLRDGDHRGGAPVGD